MKKLQQRLVALAMAGVMLVGHMYAYTAAQDTATETAPTIGSHVNLVNLEDTPFLSAGTNYGPEDLSQTVQGIPGISPRRSIFPRWRRGTVRSWP